MENDDQTTTDQDRMSDREAEHKARIRKQINKAESANQETMKQLGMRGMQPNPLDLTRLRMEVFISMTLGGHDSIQRLQYELAWQQQLQEYFQQMYQESQKSKLHVPGRD